MGYDLHITRRASWADEGNDIASEEWLRYVRSHFGSVVQGDDGEIYENGSTPPRQPDVPLTTKISAFLRRFLPTRPLAIDHPPLPFAIGDRVREGISGREAMVIEIDPSAMGGMGIIRVRRDDGSEVGWAMMAHDLTPIPAKKPV